jgi:predicted DNA-binding ribbon-helix-helix protein
MPKDLNQPQTATSVYDDLLGEIPIIKRQGRDTTVYMDNEVHEVITKIANERKVSNSKVINKLLRRVLLVE